MIKCVPTQPDIDESDRLSKLISDILRLNKLDNQTILPEVSTYDLCRQLAECILQFDSILDERELELEADMEDSFLITADKSLLELVWNNLLSNAVKFTDKNGTVSVREHSDGEIVPVTVSDTGCGMDEKTQEHIFEKFYQGDTSHSAEGNGLGMALVGRVIGLSGGHFSEEYPGTGFFLHCQAAEGHRSRRLTGWET